MTHPAPAEAAEPTGAPDRSRPPRRWLGRTSVWALALVLVGAVVVLFTQRTAITHAWLTAQVRAGDWEAFDRFSRIDRERAEAALDVALEVTPARSDAAAPSHDELRILVRSERGEPIAVEVLDVTLWIEDGESRYGPRGTPLHTDFCGERAPHQPPKALEVGAVASARIPLSVGAFCGLVEHSKCGPLLREGSLAGYGTIDPGVHQARLTLTVPAGAFFSNAHAKAVVELRSAPFTLELRR